MSIDREERGGSRRSRLPHSRPDRGSLHGLALVPRGAVHVGLRHRAPDADPPRGSHRRRVLPDPTRQRDSCPAARHARGPRGRGRPSRAAKSRDPAAVPRPSDFTSERDAGPLCRLAGDGPLGAGLEGSESHAVRHPGPALRPGCGLLRVPAPALELAVWLADGGPGLSRVSPSSPCISAPGAFRSPGGRLDVPTGPRSPIGPPAPPEGRRVPVGHVRPPLLRARCGLRRRMAGGPERTTADVCEA